MMEMFSILIKALFYSSALITSGLALQSAMGLYSRRRLMVLAAFVFLGLVVLRLIELNANAAGSWSEAFSPDSFRWIWVANAHQTYTFGIGFFSLILAVMLKPEFLRRSLLGMSAVIIAIGFGLSGHTQSLETPGIFPFLAMGHILIAGFWLTAPITLYPRVDTSDTVLLKRVERFSHVAIWLVPLLFVSGIWLLWTISGSLKAVFTQVYGQTLLIKLLFATGLLALGAYNKLKVTDHLAENPDSGRIALGKTLKAEAALFAGVVILITLATTVFAPTHG